MKRKPKVLIDSFHLFQASTGIRTYSIQLMLGLEELDQTEVEYLVYPNWRWVNRTDFLRGKVNFFKKILNHLLYFVWKQFCLPILLFIKQADMVIALDYLLPYFKFGSKGIAVIHDTFYWELKANYNPIWRSYFLKSVQRGLGDNSEIVATTEYIAHKIKRIVSDRHNVSVVYQAPKDLQEEGSQNLVVPKGEPYFLHIGIFEKRKNLEILVRAFERVSRIDYYTNHKLVLAGGRGVGIFHDDFQLIYRLIQELGLESKIVLPGFVPDYQLKSLYENAFAYIFPSKEEGFGIPVIEAMKSRIPVIISNHPALVEVADAAALIFDMDSFESLSNELMKLTSQELRKELIEKGKKRAEMFTKESFAIQFHRVVIDALSFHKKKTSLESGE
ncbi:MAG: glycosyltransferase family 4 protein [Oceanospirillaceae bacterium]|nr:glycosyltransferase family 4 protein [Oceanospirillaceae bacterium]